MENSTQPKNENNKLTLLYLLIFGLFAALIFQFFYFSRKVTAVKNENNAVMAQTAIAPSSPFSPRRSRTSRQAANTGAVAAPAAMPMMNDFFDEDPFEALDRIHSRLNNMMNTARTYAPVVMQQMNRDLSSDFIPAVDMEETDTAYLVRADIPGLEKDKINITAQNGVLVIQGTRESQSTQDNQNGMYATERHYGSFARTVALPGPVNESEIKADYKNGVLTVQVPKEKGSTAATKRIPVQ